MMVRRIFIAVAATGVFAALSTAATISRGVTSLPKVEGPVTGGSRGHPFSAYLGNISEIGYVEEEYFISGDAVGYAVVGNLTSDGEWTLTVNDTQPYKTRILIRRPINKADFNGDVILEWINVSGGFDLMISDGPGVYEAGYAYVGVSAQFSGLIGFEPNPVGLTQWDPERYGTLSIPDDALSYDIYTQAAEVLRQGTILGGIKPAHIISIGESQSGVRVLAYANGVQPLTNAFDAIIPVITAGTAALFSSTPAQQASGPNTSVFPTKIRTDLDIPVFELNTETEGPIYYLAGLRQPDTAKFHYWEVAGGAHVNTLVINITNAYATRDEIPPTVGLPSNLDTVSWLPVLQAVYPLVSKWISHNIQPPSMPKFAINGTDLTRDANGNVIGGVRQPELLVPIAAYDGEAAALFGTTTPFSASKLRELYPSHIQYVNEVAAAAAAAVAQEILLPDTIPQYIQDASTANIPPA